jgi:hypothetical protein
MSSVLYDKGLFDKVLKVLDCEGEYDVYYVRTQEFNGESGEWDKEYYTYQVVINNPKVLDYVTAIRNYLGLGGEEIWITLSFSDSLPWIKM